MEPNQQDFFETRLEYYELKYRGKTPARGKAGFQSGATEVITSEQNHSAISSSLDR